MKPPPSELKRNLFCATVSGTVCSSGTLAVTRMPRTRSSSGEPSTENSSRLGVPNCAGERVAGGGTGAVRDGEHVQALEVRGRRVGLGDHFDAVDVLRHVQQAVLDPADLDVARTALRRRRVGAERPHLGELARREEPLLHRARAAAAHTLLCSVTTCSRRVLPSAGPRHTTRSPCRVHRRSYTRTTTWSPSIDLSVHANDSPTGPPPATSTRSGVDLRSGTILLPCLGSITVGPQRPINTVFSSAMAHPPRSRSTAGTRAETGCGSTSFEEIFPGGESEGQDASGGVLRVTDERVGGDRHLDAVAVLRATAVAALTPNAFLRH